MMEKRRAIALASAVLLVLAVALSGSIVRIRAALAQTAGVTVSSRQSVISGLTAGEVLVGNQVVLRIRSGAGGLTAAQRAQQVSDRLRSVLATRQITGADFRVAEVNGEWAVLAGDTILITADQYQAALNRTTPQRLATIWRDRLAEAVTAQVAGFRGEAEATANKIVPIVSLGSGIRVGAARISGPASNVAEASVVGQVEATFQDVARIRIFVPLQSVTNIQRVPQVNVNAYGDIQL